MSDNTRVTRSASGNRSYVPTMIEHEDRLAVALEWLAAVAEELDRVPGTPRKEDPRGERVALPDVDTPAVVGDAPDFNNSGSLVMTNTRAGIGDVASECPKSRAETLGR